MNGFWKFGHKAAAVLLSLTLLLTGQGGGAAEKDPSELPMRDQYQTDSGDSTDAVVNDLKYYRELADEYAKYSPYTGEDICLDTDAVTGSSVSLEGRIRPFGEPARTALLWDEDIDWVEYTVFVPETALYNLKFDYYAYQVSTLDAVRELYIDGKIPYKELATVDLAWNWTDSAKPTVNALGDEVASSQKLIEKWNSRLLYDQEGYYTEPLTVLLTQGRHTIRMQYVQQGVALAGLSLVAPKTTPSYAEVKKSYAENGYAEVKDSVFFEAEDAAEKNSPNLQRVADYDPRTSPFESGFRRLNTIGNNYWNKGGQSITWEFTVPSTGLYRIDLRVNSSQSNGLPVYRQIAVDGVVPFEELKAYRFAYRTDWYLETLSSEDKEPYLFYFEAGKTHRLTMTVMAAEYTDIMLSLGTDAQSFTDYLLKVTMLTGSSPDVNYEYDIEENIPETRQVFGALYASLEGKVVRLRELAGGKNTAAINSMEQILSSLKDCLKDPESIPRRLSTLEENQISLSSWYTVLQSMPLTVDYFEICGRETPVKNVTSRWYEKLWATLQNFMISFTKDYNDVGIQANGETGKTLSVWVSMSTEAAEILRALIDDSFTPSSGVYANVNLLPAGQLSAGAVNSLLLSMVSGKTPDVVLSVTANTAVELAIRDAALPLSDREGFAEFSAQFLPAAFEPLTFNRKVYGIPERTDFRLLFYRKDIFAQLGLTVPDTWEDFYSNTLQVLYQNQLSAYVPQDLSMFLFQLGGRYYTDDGSRTALDSVVGYRAFQELTELYTNYGVPYTTAFFNRFRSGTLPVGIGGYAEYMSLLIGAPELSGKWGIAQVPGHKNGETLNRAWSGCLSSASMIMGNTAYPDECWAFLKWWMGEEIQSRYAREVESRIGLGSRVNTANLAAFGDLSWRAGDLSVFRQAWTQAVETPGVLGGSYLTRHLNNAWNRVVVEKQDITPRDSLEEAIEEINKELISKREEYPQLVTGVNIYD